MGSQSDWPTMKHASKILKLFNIKHEVKIISAIERLKECLNMLKEQNKEG